MTVGVGSSAGRVACPAGNSNEWPLRAYPVFRPKGLLLDDPLSALDANLRVERRDEMP